MSTSDSFETLLGQLQDACFDAEETGDWDASNALAVRAVQAAVTPADLWRIVDLEPGAEATYDEGEWPPDFLEAIYRRSERWRDPATLAEAIMLATRLTARDPGGLALIDDEQLDLRPELVVVHDRHIGLFRRSIASSEAALRTAALHAIGSCSSSDLADFERVASVIAGATHEEPLATALLCLGKLARRIGRGADVLRHVGTHQGHDSRLVRCCAAAAAALVTGSLGDAHAASLALAAREPVALCASLPKTTLCSTVARTRWGSSTATLVADNHYRRTSIP